MTVSECYKKMKSNYNDVLARLVTDERIAKYILKLLDSNDYNNLKSSLEEKDYSTAFRYVHNLKGISLNLSLTPLFETSNVLCEAIRKGAPTVDITDMVKDVDDAYALTIEAITEYKNSEAGNE